MKRTNPRLWILIAVLMAGSLAGGIGIAQSNHPDAAAPAIPMSGFAPVVKQALPAIVNISSVAVVKSSDLLFDWPPGLQMPRQRRERSAGSGVIVSPDGYILTNHHVVDGALSVEVALADKREFTARVVGTDDKTDVAILKVNAENLPVLPMGDSSTVEVGDIALAIGNPFGLGQTVTMGIVSALGRSNLGIEDYEDFIQTDASINPGNSGGALVNTRGQLIGINTAILSDGGGGNQGIGFAIPINMARSIMTQIRDHGMVTRGWLGIEVQEMDSALASAFGVKDGRGALVSGVEPNGPAARAGIQKGDVIREIGGKPTPDSRALRLQIAETAPGTRFDAKIFRNGAERLVSITLGTMPGDKQVARGEEPAATGRIGVAVEEMNAQVVIVEVQPDSPAAESGLRPGDIVQEVNRKPVSTVSDFKSAVSASNSSLLLAINRGGHTIYTVVDRNA